jgi:DnaJ-class molecular chaperone
VTAYEVLQVNPLGTQEEIRKAFQRYAVVLHPDSTATVSLEQAMSIGGITWEQAEGAYSAIKTPELRAAYDARLELLKKRCPSCRGSGTVQRWQGFKANGTRNCDVCNGTGKVVV